MFKQVENALLLLINFIDNAYEFVVLLSKLLDAEVKQLRNLFGEARKFNEQILLLFQFQEIVLRELSEIKESWFKLIRQIYCESVFLRVDFQLKAEPPLRLGSGGVLA